MIEAGSAISTKIATARPGTPGHFGAIAGTMGVFGELIFLGNVAFAAHVRGCFALAINRLDPCRAIWPAISRFGPPLGVVGALIGNFIVPSVIHSSHILGPLR